MNHLSQRRRTYWLPSLPHLSIKQPILKEWLTEKKSLTEKAEHCIGPVEVKLLTSQWQRPNPSEAVMLNISSRQLVFVREIYICSNENKYWYGRTIVPRPLIFGKMRLITRLGTRPLANLLFPHAPLKRGPFEFAQLNERHFEYHQALQHTNEQATLLFGRRSQFFEKRHRFLLTEVFLPVLITKLAKVTHC